MVSFAYPLFPVLFLLVGIVDDVSWDCVLKPYISLATGVTIATGALVYHLRLRSRART